MKVFCLFAAVQGKTEIDSRKSIFRKKKLLATNHSLECYAEQDKFDLGFSDMAIRPVCDPNNSKLGFNIIFSHRCPNSDGYITIESIFIEHILNPKSSIVKFNAMQFNVVVPTQ